MKNPCYDPETKTSCQARRPGCAVDCCEWAEYVEQRDKVYEARRAETELDAGVIDIHRRRKLKRAQRRLDSLRRKR